MPRPDGSRPDGPRPEVPHPDGPHPDGPHPDGSHPDGGLHWAARVEDLLGGGVRTVLRRRGWQPRVLTYVGYGSPEWSRVLARVLLAPPGSRTRDVGGARGWRRFAAVSAADVEVTVSVGGTTRTVRSARGGYVDVVVPGTTGPGWATASLVAPGSGRPPSPAAVRVVGGGPAVGIVSDIDDTVVVTALPRPLLAAWNTFVRRESARRPVPGMARLYGAVLAEHPGTPVFYLSTGAWNVAPALRAFLRRHGFPAGPLLLTDWGPTPHRVFRSGTEHKRTQLRRLFAEFPQLRWLLVGDDGQHDPATYDDAARRAPDRVAAVLIRQLTAAQQVLTNGVEAPRRAARRRAGESRAVLTAEVEQLRAPDGFGLADRLRATDLLRQPDRMASPD